jgi:hypothetical protein
MKINIKKTHYKISRVHNIYSQYVKSPAFNTAGDLDSKKGFVALMTIVIVSAAALIIAYSASFLGLGELDMGYVEYRGSEAYYIADGCMEEALERLRLDASYTGSILSMTNGSCIMSVVTGGGISTTTITASTTDSYHKKLESVTAVSGGVVTINSWEEKTD